MSKVTKISEANTRLYDVVMSNTKQIGKKAFADIPLELLFADELFQRVDPSSKAKIRKLADKWNPDKMDALKVVPHPEEKRFSVVDGYHRMCAAAINKQDSLECEIVLGLSKNPKERLIQEATLFATQNDEVDILSPIERHKANVLRGVDENVIVDELCQKYHIALKKNPSHGRVQTGQLGGFTFALGIAKICGREMLDTVLNVLCESRWDMGKNGLSANALHVVYNLLRLHPNHQSEICSLLISLFTPIEPEQFFAQAYTKYPIRKEKERCLLHAEDIVCEQLGIDRVYIGGTVTNAIKTLKTA